VRDNWFHRIYDVIDEVSLQTDVVITGVYNVTLNSAELIGTTEYMTL
jgi:hypothetical protein